MSDRRSDFLDVGTYVHVFHGTDGETPGFQGNHNMLTTCRYRANYNTRNLIAFGFVAYGICSRGQSTTVPARHGIDDNSDTAHSAVFLQLLETMSFPKDKKTIAP